MTEATAMEDIPPPPGRSPLVFKPPAPTLRDRLEQGLERWREILAYAAMLLTPVIAYVGNLGFAPLAASLGIGALVFLGRKTAPSIGVALLAALLLWALASMSWSPAMPLHPDFHRYRNIEPLTGVKLAFELGFYASFVMAMRLVPDVAASRASLLLAIGLTILVVLLVIESIDGAMLYQWIKAATHQKTRPDLAMRNVARACYVATVLFWPVVLRLRRSRFFGLIAVFAGGLAIAAVVFKVDSPILALILAALTFAAVQAFGRRAIWLLLAGVVIYFAVAPMAAQLLHSGQMPGQIGKQSWSARLGIWRFAAHEILQNPLRGWGLDASRAWPKDIPLHPHDAALQLWLELGVAGAGLAALFWAWLLTRIAALAEADRNMAAAAAASAVAYLTIGALSFGVWQEWWLAVGAIALATCTLVAASRRIDPLPDQELIALNA